MDCHENHRFSRKDGTLELQLASAFHASFSHKGRRLQSKLSRRTFPPFIGGGIDSFLKLNSRPQHPLSGRDVTLVTEREGWGLTRRGIFVYI